MMPEEANPPAESQLFPNRPIKGPDRARSIRQTNQPLEPQNVDRPLPVAHAVRLKKDKDAEGAEKQRTA
jgi:hypothetical protein